MVHNGIEYGLMQAYAEGFDILQERRTSMRCPRISASTLDIADIAEVWRRGSVIPPGCSISRLSALAKERGARSVFRLC